jgi:Tfp pilus assembly PilM family ATPase
MPENELFEGLIPAGLLGPPKLSTCIGLYIAPDSVQLASASISEGKAVVGKVVSVPLPKPPAPEESPEAAKKRTFFATEFLSNKEALTHAIGRGVEELGARTHDVVVSLSPQLSIVRYFLMPPVEKRFWKTSVPLEAKKYIPFPLEGIANDYQVTPPVSEAKKGMMGVLLGVTPQPVLEQIVQIIRAAGLNPVAMEPSHCSALRFWGNSGALGEDGQAQIRVHFDAARAYVILTSRGLPLLCREVDLPQDEYALSQKKLDLASALDFAERYLGIEQISKVRVTGTGEISQRSAMITKEIDLPVEREAAGVLPNVREASWGACAAAGSALRNLSPTPVAVDFTQTGRMREEDKTLILIWVAGLGVFLLFTMLALVNEFRIVGFKKELVRLTRKAAVAGVTQGMTASDLRSKIDGMATLVGAMEMMTRKPPVAAKLQELADVIPPSVWLENIQYSDSLTIGEAAKRSMQIAGAAEYGSRERDIEVGNEFKEALSKDAVFFNGFNRIDISYSGSSMMGAGNAAGPGGPVQGGPAPGGERKTAFVLILGSEVKK